jgi:hypothetical protein
MSLKTIQMDPTHLKLTKQRKTKKAIIPPSVMINQPNLRQILLDKLMKHRKTQKKKDPDILSNNFDEQCMFPDGKDPEPHHFEPAPTVLEPAEVISSVPTSIVTSLGTDKPYGVLKNGIKPTFKTWNKTQKHVHGSNLVHTITPTPISSFKINTDTPIQIIPVEIKEPLSQECDIPVIPCEDNPVVNPVDKLIETKVPIKIGKSKKNKTVQILIPCNQTRKNRTEEHDTFRKTSLSTVKNYLKSRKLIKVGTTAPTNLIRQIYENAKSYGDVVNENKHNLLYNFDKDAES